MVQMNEHCYCTVERKSYSTSCINDRPINWQMLVNFPTKTTERSHVLTACSAHATEVREMSHRTR